MKTEDRKVVEARCAPVHSEMREKHQTEDARDRPSGRSSFLADSGAKFFCGFTGKAHRRSRGGGKSENPAAVAGFSSAVGKSGLWTCWDRSRARPAVGGGLPLLLFRMQGGFTIPPWRRFPKPPYNAVRPDFPGTV